MVPDKICEEHTFRKIVIAIIFIAVCNTALAMDENASSNKIISQYSVESSSDSINSMRSPITFVVPIGNCTTIDSPGEFVLNKSIMNSPLGSCINITSSNVVFDGAGNTIDGIDYDNTYGIYVYSPITLTNVTVKNVKVTDWSYGIYYKNSIYGNIANNIANSNSNGIYLSSSGTNTLTNNTANSNSNGIYLYDSKSNTLTINNANLNSNGIYLFLSSSNTLSYNNADSNRVGIYLGGSNVNTINSNSANSNKNNGNGIELSNSNSNTFTSNTAILNDNGFYIRYSDANTFYGNTANLNYNGYVLVESENVIFTGNSANMNSNTGFYFFYSTGNTLTKNNVTMNANYGIFDSFSNNIYNNYFNNMHNVAASSSVNYWNTSKQAGKNIIGGPYIGGNFWAQPDSKGFSQDCIDEDRDGICDSSYILNAKNVDYFPLTYVPDLEAPYSVMNLKNVSYAQTHINFTWVNPPDPDFSHVILYLNGTFLKNITAPQNFVNITGLSPDTLYELGTHTVDTSGNINQTWVNATARTAPTDSNPPVADCGTDKLKCENIASPVQFNASSSYDLDGYITSYLWDFGDGTNGTGAAPTHKYSTYKWNGTAYLPFIANITVTDNGGMTNSTSQKVVIWRAGDANGDGKVNIIDAALVGLKWGSVCVQWDIPCTGNCADLNNDGKVNIVDASIIGLNWGKSA